MICDNIRSICEVMIRAYAPNTVVLVGVFRPVVVDFLATSAQVPNFRAIEDFRRYTHHRRNQTRLLLRKHDVVDAPFFESHRFIGATDGSSCVFVDVDIIDIPKFRYFYDNVGVKNQHRLVLFGRLDKRVLDFIKKLRSKNITVVPGWSSFVVVDPDTG